MPERSRLPESPLLGLHNPKSEKQICNGMGQNARRQAFRSIRHQIVESAGQQCRYPISFRMRKREEQCYSSERKPRKASKRDTLEILGDQITKQKSAPENLFDQWDYHHKPQKTKRD